MGFILEPIHGDAVHINSWNWRPTLEILHKHKVVTSEELESLEGGWLRVNEDGAARIAAFLDWYLANLGPHDRVLLDGTVTNEPDTYEFYRVDQARNYSATAPWLTQFRDFCRSSGGFRSY